MDEMRIKRIEFAVTALQQESAACKEDRKKSEERINTVDKRVDVLTENTLAVVHLTDTINRLVDALAFLSKIAKALLSIGAAFAALWVGIKHLFDSQ